MIVSQLTARRDYAIPKIMYDKDKLDMFFTDAYYNPSVIKSFYILDKILPRNLINTYKRYSPEIPAEKVDFDWKLALRFRWEMRKNNDLSKYSAQVKAYKSLAKRVIAYCEKNPKIKAYYSFDTASVEFFEWAKDKGYNLYLDQSVAPRTTQIELLIRLQKNSGRIDQDIIDSCKRMQIRERREWELATVIFAPSTFVKDELIKAGAPPEKIYLVPFGYDSPIAFKTRVLNFGNKHINLNKTKIVLFAGNAGYRKGVLDLLKISRELKSEDVKFLIAGQLETEIASVINNYPNVYSLGKLPLPELLEQYKKADIFFFPSYLEGSSRVIFEAMSWGLPVVTTFETGSVITNLQEGFLSKAGDLESMKNNILSLLNDAKLREKMGKMSIETCAKFSVEYYRSNLFEVITNYE